jgi:hypothetical protein
MFELKIGFVGLGDQGTPMAEAISDAGFELHVWARRPQSFDAISTGKRLPIRETSPMSRGRPLNKSGGTMPSLPRRSHTWG